MNQIQKCSLSNTPFHLLDVFSILWSHKQRERNPNCYCLRAGKTMSNQRTICRPHIHIVFFSSFICCRNQAAKSRVSFRNPYSPSRVSLPCSSSPWFDSNRNEPWFRVNQRRTLVRASKWTEEKSPYETLGKF